jgi:hypothetical protein
MKTKGFRQQPNFFSTETFATGDYELEFYIEQSLEYC